MMQSLDVRIVVLVCRGKYQGPEPNRLAALTFAAYLGAAFVDVELKCAPFFFAGE